MTLPPPSVGHKGVLSEGNSEAKQDMGIGYSQPGQKGCVHHSQLLVVMVCWCVMCVGDLKSLDYAELDEKRKACVLSQYWV
jgi:hypothetical protein